MKFTIIQYGVGIDVSKKELYVHFLGKTDSETFKTFGQRKFKNTPAGITGLIQWINHYRSDPSLALRIYLEVTGVYHEQVLFRLYEQGYAVSLLLGKRVKAYGRSLGEDSKNDQRDSYVLAHMALSRKERKWAPVSKHILEIRGILRLRKSLVHTRVAYSNRLHALKHSLHSSEEVQTTLEEMITQVKHQIQRLEKKALALAKADEQLYANMHRIVDSLPGLGLLTMLEIISETNGFSTFHSVKQLVKYAGFDIIENQSGAQNGRTRISKNGNAILRQAVYMPSLTLIREKVSPFYGLFMRVLKRNPKIKKKALVAVQRKLLILIYTLWKKGEAFDPEFHIQEGQESTSQDKEKGESRTSHTKEGGSKKISEPHGIVQQTLTSSA